MQYYSGVSPSSSAHRGPYLSGRRGEEERGEAEEGGDVAPIIATRTSSSLLPSSSSSLHPALSSSFDDVSVKERKSREAKGGGGSGGPRAYHQKKGGGGASGGRPSRGSTGVPFPANPPPSHAKPSSLETLPLPTAAPPPHLSAPSLSSFRPTQCILRPYHISNTGTVVQLRCMWYSPGCRGYRVERLSRQGEQLGPDGNYNGHFLSYGVTPRFPTPPSSPPPDPSLTDVKGEAVGTTAVPIATTSSAASTFSSPSFFSSSSGSSLYTTAGPLHTHPKPSHTSFASTTHPPPPPAALRAPANPPSSPPATTAAPSSLPSSSFSPLLSFLLPAAHPSPLFSSSPSPAVEGGGHTQNSPFSPLPTGKEHHPRGNGPTTPSTMPGMESSGGGGRGKGKKWYRVLPPNESDAGENGGGGGWREVSVPTGFTHLDTTAGAILPASWRTVVSRLLSVRDFFLLCIAFIIVLQPLYMPATTLSSAAPVGPLQRTSPFPSPRAVVPPPPPPHASNASAFTPAMGPRRRRRGPDDDAASLQDGWNGNACEVEEVYPKTVPASDDETRRRNTSGTWWWWWRKGKTTSSSPICRPSSSAAPPPPLRFSEHTPQEEEGTTQESGDPPPPIPISVVSSLFSRDSFLFRLFFFFILLPLTLVFPLWRVYAAWGSVYVEEVIVATGVGVYITSYGLWNNVRQTSFIDVCLLRSLVIHDTFFRYQPIFFLSATVESWSSRVVFFPHTLPRLDILLPVLRGMRAVLFGEAETGLSLAEMEAKKEEIQWRREPTQEEEDQEEEEEEEEEEKS